MILALAVTELELAELECAHLRSLAAGEPGRGETRGGRVPDRVPEPLPGTTEATSAAAAAQARRSLVARGLVTPDGALAGGAGASDADGAADAAEAVDTDGVKDGAADQDGTSDEGGRAHGDAAAEVALVVRTTLDVRAAATRTLVVDRLVATSDPCHALHGVRLVHLLGDVACVEDLSDAGTRYLWLLLDLEEVPAAVAGVTVPEDAAPGRGPVRRALAGRPEALRDLLERPTVLATLSVLDGEAELKGEHLLALGPAGCWVADRRPAAVPATDLIFRPVDPDWVVRRVRDLIPADDTGGHGTGGTPAGSADGPGPAWGEGTMAG